MANLAVLQGYKDQGATDMKAGFVRARMAKAVAVVGLLCGSVVVLVPGLASASKSVALYVAPGHDGGNDRGGTNPCTNKVHPCATIAHALGEEARLAPNSIGSVINLSKGTFNDPADGMFKNIAAANTGVTITGTGGKGKEASVVEPASCRSIRGPLSDGGFAIVGLDTGDNGITVTNVTINSGVVAGCPGYGSPAGAAVDITGGTTGNAVVGDIIESGAFGGILTDSGADSTIIANTLSPMFCNSAVRNHNAGLNSGWTSPAGLLLTTVPLCALFESGRGNFTGVSIDGVDYCATQSASKDKIVLTGLRTSLGCGPVTNGDGVGEGSTVTFNTSVASFLQYGISCNSLLSVSNNATTCAISGNTVTAGVTELHDFPSVPGGTPPFGIVSTGGAHAYIDGNTVTGVADNIPNDPFPGQTTNDGTGIALYPNAAGIGAGNSVIGVNHLNAPPTGHGNKLTGDDIGILVVAGSNAPAVGYQVNANSVELVNNAGVIIEGLGAQLGPATADLVSPMEDNTLGGSTGAGLELLGDVGQTIGGPLSTQGNDASGNQVGIVLGPCTSSLCETSGVPGVGQGSQSDLVQNNTVNDNILSGVLDAGPFQPNEEVEQVSAAAINMLSTNNRFDRNTWTGNGTIPSAFAGTNVMDGTGWGGGCASQVGSCNVPGSPNTLTFVGAATTFNSANPGSATITLAVCNPQPTIPEPLPVGSEITLDANPAQAADGGTFFVTASAIVPASGTHCANATPPSTTISIQAVEPFLVGTASNALPPANATAPSLVTGQPYVLGTGDTIDVNQNGPAVVAAGNIYGSGGNANSCTPLGVNGIPNIFGAPAPPGSDTLNAGTGGVNATYSDC